MNIEKIRHSLAHILAYAVQELYPGTKFGIGPAIENGFYYDFALPRSLTLEDLPKVAEGKALISHPRSAQVIQVIEEKMRELIKKEIKFEKKIVSKKEAKEIFKDQPYKLELVDELSFISPLCSARLIEEKGQTSAKLTKVRPLQIYQAGGFVDLCQGPHVKSTKEINADAFKLTKVAGAYWRGDEKKPMLTRIYGVAFETKKQLNDYLAREIEAEKRDHRVLGQKLELFIFDEEVGAGLPLWMPRGAILRKIIEDYLQDELKKQKYQWVVTPHIGKLELWKTSGHWDLYRENMYSPIKIAEPSSHLPERVAEDLPHLPPRPASQGSASEGREMNGVQRTPPRGDSRRSVIDEEEFLLKPMNCPFHVKIYQSKIRSYKDLPLKYAELGTVYRYERTGVLHGLTRVRGFTQDDAHIWCTNEQLSGELTKLLKDGLRILKTFGFKDYEIYLSTRPEKYAGTTSGWEKATKTLKYALGKLKLKWRIDPGGGVFYGPKIDIKIKDSLQRPWQCTTIQVDFNLPERFNVAYINQKGRKKRPIMIHRALLGSLERFVGVLIEHYGGALPLWLSPVQAWLIPVGSRHKKYAKEIVSELASCELRVELKDENETVSKKIREGEIQKIPYLLVVGDKEMKTKSVRVRKRNKGDIGMIKLNKFLKRIEIEIEAKK